MDFKRRLWALERISTQDFDELTLEGIYKRKVMERWIIEKKSEATQLERRSVF